MYKIILSIIFVSLSLFSKETLKDENIQILAENLEIKDDIVNASGEVVVYSLNYYITANRLVYDKVNAKLELFDNVNIVRNNEVISYSEYMFLDLNQDINTLKPMLMLDNTNKLWFNSKTSSKDNDLISLNNSTLSSCDCINPAWSISFSSGDMNTTKQWINTYNATLYLNNTPVLYTPYFGFPTDTTRRTGLLKPTIGFSKSEGFMYAQPIYYAPKLNYDFEYTPQIRTKRGDGHALKYRYVDSLYSDLNIETAIFRDKDEYFEEQGLTNQKHYGWDLEYKRTKLLSKKDHSDGLRIKYTDMNDVDYLDTQKNSASSFTTDKSIESEAKYFYNTNNYYGDIEVNLYNDLTQDNNDNVLQTIPKVNFHKYSQGYFNNKITTSFNIASNKKTRTTGVGAVTTNIDVPFGYHQYLFDDFLNFSFVEQINYTNIAYENTNLYDDVNYAENNHIVSLYTDLIKPYDSFIHTMKLSTSYTDTNVFKETGDIYNQNDNATADLSPFPILKSTKNITLGLNHSFYDRHTLEEIVNHKINQSYQYNDTSNSYEKHELENDIIFYYDYGSLSHRLIYNYDIKDVTQSFATFNFNKDNYFFNLYYLYLQDEDTLEEDKNFNYELGFDFAKYYKLSYKEKYDLIEHVTKSRELNFNINEKCWAMNFRFVDSLVASDTTKIESNSYRQKILYIEINLKELFIIEQQHELSKRANNS